jgi:hypothetical protein
MAADLKLPITAQDRTGQAFQKLEGNLKKAERGSSGLLAKWRDLTIVGSGVIRAAQGLARAVGSTFAAADRQQAAEVRLALAFRNTGREVEKNLTAMKEWASERQGMTRWGDEMSLELATLGVALGKLAGEDLQRAITASQDFADGFHGGGNPIQMMQLLARAASGADVSFSRVGITLDSSLEGMDKFRAAVEQVEQRFGGMAKVMAATASGPLVQFSNAWGDLQEKFGLIIANTKVFRGVLKWLTSAVADLASQDGIAKWAERVDKFLFAVADGVLAVGLAIVQFFTQLNALGQSLMTTWSRLIPAAEDMAGVFGAMAEDGDSARRTLHDLRVELRQLFDGMDYSGADPVNIIKRLFDNLAETVEQGGSGLPTPEDFAKQLLGGEDLWAEMGSAYGGVFIGGMVDAFDSSVAPQDAFRDMGVSAKDNFVAQVSGTAWDPINQSMGKIATALASPFALVGKVLDQMIVAPVAKFVEGIMTEIVGFLGRLMGFAAVQQATAAQGAAATLAMWLPIVGALSGAAVAASIASFGAASAFGPAALAQIQAAQALGAIPAEEGGLFLHKPGTGGTLVNLAEREPELVLPLSQLDDFKGGGGSSVTIGEINVSGAATNEETAQVIVDELMARLEEGRLGGRI